MPLPAVQIIDLHKSFGELKVLKGIDCSIARGEVVCLIGSSGSGKSTLLRCIHYLETPDSGLVRINGEPIGYRENTNGELIKIGQRALAAQRSKIGFVFQLFNLWPHKTVLGNVIEALLVVKRMGGNEARDLGLAALENVDLLDKLDDYPSTLSGGQQQRVAIARMLAMEPEILLFDEPTSALDPELVCEVTDVMRKLASEGRTMIIATHEMGFARDTADRMMFLDDGTIAEEAPAEEFFTAPRNERTRVFINRIRSA